MSDLKGGIQVGAEVGAEVGKKANRMLKARRLNSTQGVWFGMGMMGLVGWSVVVPTLIGTAVGAWWDGRHPGSYSWTLMLLIIGLSVGCLNAWHWVAKEDKEMREDNDQ